MGEFLLTISLVSLMIAFCYVYIREKFSKDPLTYSDNNNNNNKKYSKYNARYITGSGEILRFLRLRHTPPADDLKPRRINFLNNHGIIINDRYSASYYNFDPDENGNKINNKRLYSEYNYPNARNPYSKGFLSNNLKENKYKNFTGKSHDQRLTLDNFSIKNKHDNYQEELKLPRNDQQTQFLFNNNNLFNSRNTSQALNYNLLNNNSSPKNIFMSKFNRINPPHENDRGYSTFNQKVPSISANYYNGSSNARNIKEINYHYNKLCSKQYNQTVLKRGGFLDDSQSIYKSAYREQSDSKLERLKHLSPINFNQYIEINNYNFNDTQNKFDDYPRHRRINSLDPKSSLVKYRGENLQQLDNRLFKNQFKYNPQSSNNNNINYKDDVCSSGFPVKKLNFNDVMLEKSNNRNFYTHNENACFGSRENKADLKFNIYDCKFSSCKSKMD